MIPNNSSTLFFEKEQLISNKTIGFINNLIKYIMGHRQLILTTFLHGMFEINKCKVNYFNMINIIMRNLGLYFQTF